MKSRQTWLLAVVFALLIHLPPARTQDNTEAEAERLYAQVLGLIQQARYDEALPLAERLTEMVRRLSGEAHPAYATCLNNLAEIYRNQGRYADAEPLYKRSLAIREQALGPDHPDVATSLNNLAALYATQGRYADAEPLYKRSLAILENILGPDHPRIAKLLNNLAALFEARGEYGEAELLYRRSLAISEGALGPDHPDVARTLNNLAELCLKLGRHSEAEPLFERALAVREKALGPDHPDVAQSLNNLAVLYGSQGKYAEAEPLYRRSLSVYEKALGPDHPDVANVLNNLAELYCEEGRYERGEPLFGRGLAIQEKSLGPDHLSVAATKNNLAESLRQQGRYAEAEPLFRRSLATRERALGPDSPDVATSLNNLAALLNDQGKAAEAEPLYRRSVAILEKALGPDHPDKATALFNLAAFCFAQDRPQEAEPLFERALRSLSSRFEYSFLYMSEKDRLQFLDAVSFDFPMYFSFCLRARERVPGLAGRMYDVLLWQKGLVAQSMAALRARVRASGDPQAARLFDLLTQVKSELAKLVSAPAEADPHERASRQAQADRLEAEANDLEKELVSRSPALGEEKGRARVNWRQVRDALEPREAAVEIARFPYFDGKTWTGEGYYVALVLRRESREPAFIVLGERKALERAPLADYRRLAAAPESGNERPAGLGQRFYAAFWKPLEAELGDAKRVWLSPDGELNQVSLGIVPGRDGRMLLESHDLRLVNGTKDLVGGAVASASGDAVLVGDPNFELSEAGEGAALGSAVPRPRDLRGGALNPLPGTKQEVEEIAALIARQGWNVRTLTGNEALEERVKGLRQPRLLHLATHGFFAADELRRSRERAGAGPQTRRSAAEDPMLRSGLYLAGANRALKGGPPAPDLEDGIFTASEASQLDLQGTELVVLSACETGLGKTEAGEGVFGLRRAFQVAGARAVLMSLWSVPDEETRELASLFYKKWLAGAEKHRALGEAQLEMRERVKARYGEDLPFFWGAFVLVGR